MKPYKITEETPTHVTYEFQTAYQYALFAIVAVAAIGVLSNDDKMANAGLAALTVYMVAKLALGFDAILHIRRATRANTVEFRGNKVSFSNPLRIRVPKKDGQEGTP